MALRRRVLYPLCILFSLSLAAGCSDSTEVDDPNDDPGEPGDAPVVEIVEGPEERSNEVEATFSFECVDDQSCTFLCGLDEAAEEPCESPTAVADLADGERVFEVVAVDEDGQESEPARWTWTVDTEAPSVIDLEGPDAITNEVEATLSFECSKEECTFECTLDDAAMEACQSPVTVDGLDDGEYLFSVRATDDLGNEGQEATHAWTVDREAPLVIDLEGPDEVTNDRAASFEFGCSKEGCTYECQLDGGEAEDCSPGVVFDDLSDGERELSIRATDELDNQGPAAHWEWTVDTEVPEVVDMSGPEALTNEASASFEFDCSKEDCSYECQVDDGPVEACSPGVEVSDVEDGEREFTVVASDEAGNESEPAHWEWTVDTEVPEVVDVSGPETLTNEASATFEFDCSKADCSYQCQVDDGPVEACSSGVEVSDVEDGEREFTVVAIDEAGNESEPAQWSWTVDTEVPEVVNQSGPDALTNETTVSLGFGCSKSGCEFSCELEGPNAMGPISCLTGIQFTDLNDGEHEFTVVASDEAGNESEPAQWSWTVDTVVPEVVDLSGPEALTNETTASFDFDCTKADCDYECQLEGDTAGTVEEAASCQPGKTYEDLEDDDYTLTVVASDGAGNESAPVEWLWTIYSESPDIDLTASTDSQEASFEFECTNTPDCSFECALAYDFNDDDWETGPWESCTSPYELDGLEEGEYEFFVEATDDLGNQSMESHQWSAGPRQWSAISVGSTHTCSVATDGTLWCWGENGLQRRLGLGDEAGERLEPTQLMAEDDDLATGWTDISSGTTHNCAVRDDGSLWCWGSTANGRLGQGSTFAMRRDEPHQTGTNDSALETGWTDVSAGGSHTCGLRDDSSLWCWGLNEEGQLGLGENALFGGGTSNENTPEQVLADDDDLATGWEQVSAGERHTCGLREDGTLWCWGSVEDGRLGLDDLDDLDDPEGVLEPQQVLADDDDLATGWEDITVRRSSSCARRGDGSLWCWGDEFWAQWQDDDDDDYPTTPQQWMADDPDLATGWSTISLLESHSCAVRDDGSLWCWGEGEDGKLGLGDTEDRDTPQQVMADDDDLATGWGEVAVGAVHSCALREDGDMWCWGGRPDGQVGDGLSASAQAVPMPMTLDASLVAIEASGFFGCALDDEQRLWCWGSNGNGRLGVGDDEPRKVPHQVMEDDADLATGWNSISTGSGHTCATREDATLWCWGQDINGRLGLDGGGQSYLTPQQVTADDADLATGWTQVSNHTSHSCAVRDDGTLWCWGRGAGGRLGLGSATSTQTLPQQVMEDDTDLATGWESVSVGETHSCAVREDGTLWCWGVNDNGQVGVGDDEDHNEPQQLMADDADLATGWAFVDSGQEHSCAVREDGTMWCWGENSDRQLGVGDTDDRDEPEQVLAGDADLATGWESVSAGDEHSCAVRSSGGLYCWGRNSQERLGIDMSGFQDEPVPVAGGGSWSVVSAGNNFSLGVLQTGAGYAWGATRMGQTGNDALRAEEPIRLEVY